MISVEDDKVLGCLGGDAKWTTGEVTQCGVHYAIGDGFIRDPIYSPIASYYTTVDGNNVITAI